MVQQSEVWVLGLVVLVQLLKKKSLMDSRNESMDAGVEQKWVHPMDSAFYPRKLLQCG